MLLTSVTDQAETPTAGRLTSPHVNTRPTERHFPKGAPGTRPGRLRENQELPGEETQGDRVA